MMWSGFNFKEWFRARGRLQVLSVVLAMVAWFVVSSGQTVKQKFEFNLQYSNLPSNLVFVTTPPQKLRVTLVGSLHRLRGLEPETMPYVVDLSGARAGPNSIEIETSFLRLPLDVRVLNPNPRRLDFQLEELARKDVPLDIEMQGKLAAGFLVSKIELTPPLVQLMGPASVIEKISSIPVSINVEGKTESFTTSIPIQWKNTEIRSVDSVLAEVMISQLNVEKEFNEVAVTALGSSDQRITIQPSVATVRVRGSQDAIDALTQKIKVVVSVEGLQKGRYRIRGQLDTADDVVLLKMLPDSFIVEVK